MDSILYEEPMDKNYLKIVEETANHPGVWINHNLWFNPLEIKTGEEDFIPDILKSQLIIWREEASKVEDDFPYIKYAQERFVYNNNYYILYPSALNISEVQMDRYFTKIEDYLYKIGCLYVVYDGTLD